MVSTDTVALTAIVSQFFDINVSIIPSTFVPEYPGQEPSILNVDPGSTISYNIEVTNVGNGDDFVIITPTVLEVNWESTFFLGSEERVTSELNLNESVTFIMQIRIPKDQLAGTYTTGINVTSIGDREIKKFDTVINKVFNLSVYGVMHSELTSDKILNDTIQFVPGVSPGSILYYLFEITNGGNDWDQINIKFDPMKPSSSRATASEAEDISLAAWSEFEELDWEAYIIGLQNTEAYLSEVKDMDFGNNVDISHQTAPIGYLNSNTTTREMNLTLGVGQTVWLKVQLIVPRDIPDIDDELHPVADDPWYFRLEAKSTDPDADPNGNYKDVDPDNNEVLIKNIILLPDLEVVGKNINYPSNMEPGKIVTISAEIRNIGDIEAKEVIVTFYVNGKEVRSQTLRELDKDQSRLIPFTWEVASGDNELKIKVDPENAIVEIREDNNEASKKETIEAGGILEIFSNREFCSILPIIIVVIILAFILIIIKKRGDFLGLKPGGGGEI